MQSSKRNKVKLGELLSSVSETHKFDKAELIFLNTSDIHRGRILHRKYSKVDEMPGQAKKSVRGGDILFSEIRPANGRWALLTGETKDFVVSTKLMVLRTNPKLALPEFMYIYLTSNAISSKLQSIAEYRSATFPQITFEQVSELEIDLPTLAEQEVIIRAIKSMDDKIEVNLVISQILENIAQTIFKSWFVDFDPVKARIAGGKPVGMDEATAARFPGLMEESEVGSIPKGWKVGTLNSILKLHKSTVKAGPMTEAVPYVPVDQIEAKDIFLKNSEAGSEAKTSLVSFKKDDILFGAMRPYFHKVTLAPFDGTTRTTTFVLRAINPEYLAYSLFTVYQNEAVAYATNNSQGTTIPYAVWKNSFENYPIVIPPEPIAKAFNDLIMPIITFGYSLIAQNQTIVGIRDELLPRLLSSEMQIPDELLVT